MSSVDSFREAEAADYLAALRKHIAENKSGNTSAENFVPQFILEFFNQIDISNAVNLNNNKHEFANQIDISNNKYLRAVVKGNYRIGADNNDQYLNGKRFISDGASQKDIVRRSWLEATATQTIAVRAKLAGFTGTRRQLVHKQTANNGYMLYAEASANNIVIEWYNGSALISSQTVAFTPGTFFNVVATFQSGNQDLYKDGSSADTDTVADTLAVAAVDLGYGGQVGGTERLAANDVVEQLVVIDRYIDSAWATRFNNAYADLENASDRVPGMCNFMVVA